jgi:serine protease 16
VTDKLFMWQMAEEQGALMIALEHRFYGQSYPTKDMSNGNLVYLTSSQALADLARFIEYVSNLSDASSPEELNKATPPLRVKASVASSKWVSFGGSYPGNLATWLKLKYPASIVGTVGSSAPVKGDYNYYKYAQVVGSALAYPLIGGSDECYAVVEKASSDLHDLITSTNVYGVSPSVPDSLKPCSPMTSEKDLYAYESTIFGNFQGTVQYNLQSSAATVADLCAELTQETHETPLIAMASMVDKYFNTATETDATCIFSSWDEMIAELQNDQFDGQSAMRQWIYQSCNEFGYFQTTEGEDHPFTSLTGCNLENAGKLMCEESYGIKNYKGPLKAGNSGDSYAADERYGARSVQGLNITMPNGNMDPWHSLGVINATGTYYSSDQETSPEVSVVFIDGTAHCRDMYAPGAFESMNVSDTSAVVWAHAKIKANVESYLN